MGHDVWFTIRLLRQHPTTHRLWILENTNWINTYSLTGSWCAIHHKVAKATPNHPSIINWRNSITELILIFTIAIAVWFLPSKSYSNYNIETTFWFWYQSAPLVIQIFASQSYRKLRSEQVNPELLSAKAGLIKLQVQSSLVYFKSLLFQVSFISIRASRVFQVSRSPSLPTISLSREALWSARKKCEERWGGAFSRYGNWGSGGNPSWFEINKTLAFRDTWNKRDLTVYQCGSCLETLRVQHPISQLETFTLGSSPTPVTCSNASLSTRWIVPLEFKANATDTSGKSYISYFLIYSCLSNISHNLNL